MPTPLSHSHLCYSCPPSLFYTLACLALYLFHVIYMRTRPSVTFRGLSIASVLWLGCAAGSGLGQPPVTRHGLSPGPAQCLLCRRGCMTCIAIGCSACDVFERARCVCWDGVVDSVRVRAMQCFFSHFHTHAHQRSLRALCAVVDLTITWGH